MNDTALNPDIFRERLRELYARHHGLVWRICRRYVQNRDDADDLAQDVLLKAAHAWEDFGGRSAVTTWLHRVAVNHCADHHRALRRRRDLLTRFDGDAPDSGEPLDAVDDAAEEFRKTGIRLWRALQESLDGADRDLVRLRFELGMRQEGIARLMGLTRGGVSKRLARIRARASLLWRTLPAEEGGPVQGRRVSR